MFQDAQKRKQYIRKHKKARLKKSFQVDDGNNDEALKIHGIAFEYDGYSSGSDSGKSDFDEEYFKHQPPPHGVDKNNVVIIRPINALHSMNVENIGEGKLTNNAPSQNINNKPRIPIEHGQGKWNAASGNFDFKEHLQINNDVQSHSNCRRVHEIASLPKLATQNDILSPYNSTHIHAKQFLNGPKCEDQSLNYRMPLKQHCDTKAANMSLYNYSHFLNASAEGYVNTSTSSINCNMAQIRNIPYQSQHSPTTRKVHSRAFEHHGYLYDGYKGESNFKEKYLKHQPQLPEIDKNNVVLIRPLQIITDINNKFPFTNVESNREIESIDNALPQNINRPGLPKVHSIDKTSALKVDENIKENRLNVSCNSENFFKHVSDNTAYPTRPTTLSNILPVSSCDEQRVVHLNCSQSYRKQSNVKKVEEIEGLPKLAAHEDISTFYNMTSTRKLHCQASNSSRMLLKQKDDTKKANTNRSNYNTLSCVSTEGNVDTSKSSIRREIDSQKKKLVIPSNKMTESCSSLNVSAYASQQTPIEPRLNNTPSEGTYDDEERLISDDHEDNFCLSLMRCICCLR